MLSLPSNICTDVSNATDCRLRNNLDIGELPGYELFVRGDPFIYRKQDERRQAGDHDRVKSGDPFRVIVLLEPWWGDYG